MFFFFSSRRRHTRWPRDWSSDMCSSDLGGCKGSKKGGRLPAFVRPRCVRLSRLTANPHRLTTATENPAKGNRIRRSEERRVGKEWRSGWQPERKKKRRRTHRSRQPSRRL